MISVSALTNVFQVGTDDFGLQIREYQDRDGLFLLSSVLSPVAKQAAG